MTQYEWINAMAKRLHEMLPRLGVEAESKGKIINFIHSFWVSLSMCPSYLPFFFCGSFYVL